MTVESIDMLLFVEVEPSVLRVLGGQTSATLNRLTITHDATSKDGDRWSESLVGVKSWGVDCSGFIIAQDEALDVLEAAWLENKPLKVEIRKSDGNNLMGTCIIADFPSEFPSDSVSRFEVSLVGAGELTDAPSWYFVSPFMIVLD